jgi:hypothetical protein
VLFFTLRVNLSFSASFFGRVMSKVVTIGAAFSAAWCLAVAIGFSSWEKGTAANATADAAHNNGRMRRLSIYLFLFGVRREALGLSHRGKMPNISIKGRAVNREVTN